MTQCLVKELWTTMKDKSYSHHLIHLLAELYLKQNATVKVAGTFSEKFHIQKGIRQRCVMSPYLFNIMAEMLIRETLDDFIGGIQIVGKEIINLRYADDIVLIAQSMNKLQELVTRLDTVSRNKYGMHINIDKTKILAKDGMPCCITIQNLQLEQVNTFSYLGSLIAEDATSREDIRSRLHKAQGVSLSLNKLWKSHNIPMHTKIRFVEVIYMVNSYVRMRKWEIKKENDDRVKAFDMKGLRRILRIPSMARKTNEWILETANVNRNLLESITSRKVKYYGHVLSNKEKSLEKEIIQGAMSGRPKMVWMDNIKVWTELSLAETLLSLENRKKWRRIVHNATNLRIEDG